MSAAHRIVLPAIAAWLTAATLIGVPDAAWVAASVGAMVTALCAVLAALRLRMDGDWRASMACHTEMLETVARYPDVRSGYGG